MIYFFTRTTDVPKMVEVCSGHWPIKASFDPFELHLERVFFGQISPRTEPDWGSYEA